MAEVGVIGGTGYTGSEIIRLISTHPNQELVFATSRSKEGERIADHLPNLETFLGDLKFISPEDSFDVDLVYTAVPHTKAMTYVPDFLDRGIKVVDLSADYRLPAQKFEEVYDTPHIAPRNTAVYGLTELNREKVAEADLVANPGCFPTGALLSVLPFLKNKDFARSTELILFDSKTGISGAGASPSKVTHFPNVNGEVTPYSLSSHRHLAEMKMISSAYSKSNKDINIEFTPHIVPIVRGILTTTHMFIDEDSILSKSDIFELYKNYYNSSRFVRIKEDVPSIKSVVGSNFSDIGAFEISKNRIIIISTIDNLVKGAAGQAVQNANLMLGFKEEVGLLSGGMYP